MNTNSNPNNSDQSAEMCNITVRAPKRVLYFSDGTLEEYSDSEEINPPEPKCQDVVDTASMGWSQWIVHYIFRTGQSTLAACDYVGEALASFLGITTPKYQYELDEYIRLQKAQAKASEIQENSNGWLNKLDTTEQSESTNSNPPQN